MHSPVRVFIVEDSPLIRKRIIDNLHALGGFDVVGFTDIRLKEGNGIEVVRQLRQKAFASRPKIYVLSNYANAEYRHQCELVGADDFFDKSGEYDRFLETLQHVS